MNYSAIFFDGDGVTINGDLLFSEQLALDFPHINAKDMTPFFTGVFRECQRGQGDIKKEVERVMRDWGWSGTVDELFVYWHTKGTQMNNSVLRFVKELASKGTYCFMTTDQDSLRGELLSTTYGQNNPFHSVFYSADIGCKKKEPAFWDAVFSRLKADGIHLQRSEVLCVDDEPDNLDVINSFGIQTHLFTGIEDLQRTLEV